MEKIPTAFISYSWDSTEHKEWVINLANLLRDNGIDATADVFETQKGTTNLYTMMVKNIKDNDYVIIVLTPNYADKANALQGGVGFETAMLIPLVQENLHKIIPIVRCNGNTSRAIPFYLKGVHYIDFSHPVNFGEKLDELLHKIYKVDLLEKSPLGKRPDLKPRKTVRTERVIMEGFDDLVPDFREVTDADKNKFMKSSFLQIRDGLIQILESTREKNSNFDFDYENITSRKTIYNMYIKGSQKYAIKVWLGNGFGASTETINLAYGNHISDRDNSMNEIIGCEVDKDKTLKLRMTLNMFGDQEAGTPSEVLKQIWKNVIPWLR
ncbi:MAG: toll/interleukin-1 receptor domain-containing protein [Bacillota bacterium]